MADNGYDVSDYHDVDPTYGTLAELDALIADLHQRGMKLVMDLVANHTSDEHPWFVESSSSPESPKRDWYWWRDEPNNWGSFFSGPAWTYSEGRAAYYMHLFTKKQPDLNWENPEVRQAVYEVLRWWLDRGVDGFRMDVVNLISKDPELPEAPVLPGQRYGNMRQSVIDGPRVHEFLAEMHREVFDRYDRDLLLVGETGETTVEEGRLYTDPARRELDMVLHYEHVEIDHGTFKWDVRPFDLGRLRDRLAAWQEGLADVGWNSLYWDNHDQPRVVSRYGDDGRWQAESAKLLATVLHLQRGTPFVYQGDEIGMTNFPFTSIDEVDDVEAVNYYHEAVALGVDPEDVMGSLRAMCRDNGRTPMQWDSSPSAGFTTGTPWLAVNPNYAEINVAAQVDDPDSVLSHYRRLIRLRHEDPAVVDGDFTLLSDSHPQIFAFRRRHESGQLVVLSNFSSSEAQLGELVGESRGELVIGNGSGPVMAPWEARVYRR
jgi:oligo-1,6-glucosidase